MLNLLLSLFVVLLGLAITLAIILYVRKHDSVPDIHRTAFLDVDGDHSYYDRAIIEKKCFHHRHPNVKPSELRTFRRLFSLF